MKANFLIAAIFFSGMMTAQQSKTDSTKTKTLEEVKLTKKVFRKNLTDSSMMWRPLLSQREPILLTFCSKRQCCPAQTERLLKSWGNPVLCFTSMAKERFWMLKQLQKC